MTAGTHQIGRRLRARGIGRSLAVVSAATLLIPVLVALTGGPVSAAVAGQRASGWVVVPSPSPGTAQNTLFGAAAAPDGGVWAVGDRISPENTRLVAPIVEHWNGLAWTVRVMPGEQSNLLGVYAPSPGNVWTVGFYIIDLADTLPVISHYDGTRWTAVRNPALPYGILGGVAGTSGTNIWAVGRQFTATGPAVTVVEHYNGRSWVQVPSPSPAGTDYIDFAAITVISRHDIWAAGDYTDANGTFRTLIEHYDGRSWIIVPSPNAGPGSNYLTAIAAFGAHQVWAVGRAFDGSRFRPLALMWNGHRWQARLLPAAGAGDNALNGLAAGPGHTLWAAGSYTNASGTQRTLTETYRGGHWRITASPSPGSQSNILYAAAATRGGEIWAVGNQDSGTGAKTLTMRRHGGNG